MKTNKLFTEFSLKKIWDKLKQHDKALNSTVLVLNSDNWTANADGTYINTISYSSFKETDKLTVELYDDGTLTETLLAEYCSYILGFETINGGLVAIARIKPTQSMTLVIKGEFEVNEVQVSTVRCVNDFNSTDTNTPASANLARLLKEDLEDVKSNINNQNKNLIKKELTVSNVAVTTKSNSGAYWGTAVTYEDLGVTYSKIVSVIPLNWSGATSSFNLYLHHTDGIRVISDVSQTISTMPIRIFYTE